LEFDPNLIVNIALVVGALVLMKYMPRLLAFGIPFVDGAEVKAKMDRGEDVVVVDVRTEGEFTGKTGHVPGAVNLPLGDIRTRLNAVADEIGELKNHPVFLMCRTENRSTSAAKALRRAGFANVAVVKGGITGWNRAGLPVEGQGG
jgi:rhodanese-related sulfurtransferase